MNIQEFSNLSGLADIRGKLNETIGAVNVMGTPAAITADRPFAAADAAGEFFNNTATNHSLALIAGLGKVKLEQLSTGTLTVTIGSATTLTGDTATSATQPLLYLTETSAGVYVGKAYASAADFAAAVTSINGKTPTGGAVTLAPADIGADVAGAAAAAQAAAEAASDPVGSAASAQAASLQKASNLSDLTNAATARTNLGLGSIATHNTTDFVAPSGDISAAGVVSKSNGQAFGTAAFVPTTNFDAAGAAAAAQTAAEAASDPVGIGTRNYSSISAFRTDAKASLKAAVVNFLAGTAVAAGMMSQAVAFVQNPSDTTSVDDGSNVIVAGDGTRYWRVIQGDTYKIIGMVNDGNTTQTDNAPTLQAAVNFAVYFLKGMPMTAPPGAYALNSSVNLGYGINRNDGNTDPDPYTEVIFRGSGFAQPAGLGFGTQFVYTGTENVPVFAISGGRMCIIENFSLQNKTIYPTTIGLDSSWNVQNSWQQATWINPLWNANATSSTAPFCAIAIDPYTGAAPSTSAYTDYPNVTFPTGIFDASFYTSPYQYSKSASSFTALNYLKIAGFHIGMCIAPGLSTGQSDFVTMRKVWVNDCTYAYSSNGSNPRECSLIECYFNQCFKAVTSGLNNPVENGGAFGAAIVNCAFDRNIYIFDFHNVAEQYTRPIEFLNCYGENCWALGFFGYWGGGSATDDQSLGFTKGSFTFNHTGVRGVPWAMLDMTAYAGLTINGTNFKGYAGCFFIRGDNSRCAITGMARFKKAAEPTALYEKIAQNGTNGSVLFAAMQNNGFGQYLSKFTGYNTSGTSVPTVGTEHGATSVTQPGTWYQNTFRGAIRAAMVTNPRLASSFGKSGFTSMVRDANALTWTFTWAVAKDWYKIAFMYGGVGDYIVDITSGTAFAIWKSTTAALYVKQVNNYAPISGDYPALNTIHTDTTTYGSESLMVVNTRMFSPGTATFGTPNSGANTVNCYDASGNTAAVPTALPAASALPTGCKAVALWAQVNVDNTFHPAGSGTTTQPTDACAITDTTGGVLTLKKLSDLTTATANFSAGDAVKRQITLAALVLSDAASA